VRGLPDPGRIQLCLHPGTGQFEQLADFPQDSRFGAVPFTITASHGDGAVKYAQTTFSASPARKKITLCL
jgi:hypothetical protein